jgi:hypothetical protein
MVVSYLIEKGKNIPFGSTDPSEAENFFFRSKTRIQESRPIQRDVIFISNQCQEERP